MDAPNAIRKPAHFWYTVEALTTVYLDHAATTQVAPEAIAALSAAMAQGQGNPASMHGAGRAAAARLDAAKTDLLADLHVAPTGGLAAAERSHLIFVSGATEANWLAIVGATRKGRRVVISALEHPSVIAAARLRAGEHVTVVPVTGSGKDAGIVDVEAFVSACTETDDVAVAACTLVSGELGTVQPVAKIAEGLAARAFRGHFHVDAVQAFGKIPVSAAATGADSLAISSHKIHGPAGIGALVLNARAKVRSLMGTSQERELRPGTPNTAGAVGFAAASRLAQETLAGTATRVATLRKLLLAEIVRRIPDATSPIELDANSSPYILALALPSRRSQVVVEAASQLGLYISTGSACTSRSERRSQAAEALGLAQKVALIRLSLARTTTEEEITLAADRLAEAWRQSA